MDSHQTSLLAAFLAESVDFVVVGGVAVNAHGYLRATYDLDVFIRPTEQNAEAAFRALQQFGAPIEGLSPADLLSDYENLRFGPQEAHFDVLASIGEMTFDQVWANRIFISIGGLEVPFISKADLLDNKRQVGRLRDLADVEELTNLPDGETSR